MGNHPSKNRRIETVDKMNKHLIILGIAVLLLAVGLSGCFDMDISELTQFSIHSFEVEPSIINQGESANLSWMVISAQSVSIDHEIGNVSLTGTRIIMPAETTMYTLTAKNLTSTLTATTQIIVTESADGEEPKKQAWNPEYGVNYSVNVTSVIDGDTFNAIFPNGSEERVRLLGVDTPETTASGNNENEYDDITDLECLALYGLEAKDFAESWLEGETVYIQFDSTAGFKGYYGRWLAYVFLIDGIDFNEELLNNGYARVYTEGACSKESYYITLQSQAMTDRVGLWACMPEEEPPEEPNEEGLLISYVHYDAAGDDRYNLNDEYVVIINNRESSVIMTGYQLYDDSGYWNPYTFPYNFTLDSGGEVTVYTGSGVDTDTELYWGRGSPIWNNDHDTAYLFDDSYSLVDSYGW